MRNLLLNCTLFFTFSSLACSGNPATNGNNSANQTSNQTNNQANSRETTKTEKQDTELEKQIEQIATAAKGRVGMMATVLETGETVSLKGAEHFPMQSVYKFPIGMAMLRQVDNGKLKLDQKVKVEKEDFVRQGQYSPIRDKNPNGAEITTTELLRYSVSESDGTASDMTLKLAGGPTAVDAYLKELGVKDLIVANSEKEIGLDWETQYRNWSSPEASVALLKAFQEGRGLSPESRDLMMKYMLGSIRGDTRLKALLPKGTIVAHKTGSSGTQNGIAAATNNIGIITTPSGKHIAIAVFVSDSSADDKTRDEVIAKIAKAVWDKWGN